MTVADVLAAARDRPVAATLEFGSLLVSVVLLLGTTLAIASGPPVGSGGPWLAVIVLGAGFALFWTVLWPLYERLRTD